MLDPFERLGLPGRFSVDSAELERQYLARSREAHPDFHSGSTAEQQGDAEADSAAINEAYATLKDPFRRAEALLKMLGGPSASEQKEMPPAFLMELLELREQIEQAAGPAKAKIEAELTERENALFAGIAKSFGKCEPPPAAPALLKGIRQELNAAKYLRGLLRDLRSSL
jgi:molecular chaperone HscB